METRDRRLAKTLLIVINDTARYNHVRELSLVIQLQGTEENLVRR
jgi:hypothetical protein